MSKEKKNCMFQYAIAYRWINTDIIEDTDLITLTEAKDLWHKYLPDFIRHMNNREREECRPEMVIWTDCQDNASYAMEFAHIDESSVIEGGEVYNIIKVKVVV